MSTDSAHLARLAAPSRRAFVTTGMIGGLVTLTSRVWPEWLLGGGRLKARPKRVDDSLPLGMSALGLEAERDGVVFVPTNHISGQAIPLLVLFHGAGGRGQRIADRLQPLAQELGFALLAPDSRDASWDIRYGKFGADVPFIDRALKHVFERLTTDPDRIAAAGFSDGASYVLSLGITNGDLFRHLIAFSPGFMAPDERVGHPSIFISHGTEDTILPIDVTSRRLVPKLKALGYSVDYREFTGGHQMKEELVRSALETIRA